MDASSKAVIELSIEYTDGSGDTIVSDTSWKTADSAIIYNETKRGEIFDARCYDEDWDMKSSCNHHMYSEIDMWLYKHIAGIYVDEGGASFTIKPCFIDELSYVKAKYKDIEVYWDKEKLEISTPAKVRVEYAGKVLEVASGKHTFMR